MFDRIEFMRNFGDYKADKYQFITTLEGEYYPDYLEQAKLFYEPVLLRFGTLLNESKSSEEFFFKINEESQSVRIQLLRIFRKYISPDTSVEMLKVKNKASAIVEHFGSKFRDINAAKEKFNSRSIDDEVLIAILHEYQDRGKKGYDLTGKFFSWFEEKFSAEPTLVVNDGMSSAELLPQVSNSHRLRISGPIGAGKDIILSKVFEKFPKNTPVDFIIWDSSDKPLIIGFARYDSDRGGSQEDDRIKGNSDNITDILTFSKKENLNLKVLLLNDGPGLLLGSMWDDYSQLEIRGSGKVMVSTLKMLNDRVTYDWIAG